MVDIRKALEQSQKNIRTFMANRLKYPISLLGKGSERILTAEEIQEAISSLDGLMGFVDSEFTVLILKAEETK